MTEHNFDAKAFFVADGSYRSLAKSIIAAPGMGKSVWISETLPDAIEGEEAFRCIYVSPKHETLSGKLADAPIIYSPEDLVPALNENTVVQFFPNIETMDSDLDSIIDQIFELSEKISANGGVEVSKGVFKPFSVTLIIDDAQSIDSLSNRKALPNSVKRATVLGRSRRIMPIFVTHRINALPRLVASNIGECIYFRTGSADRDNVKRVLNIDPDDIPEMEPFYWLHIDLMGDKITGYSPLEI